MAVGFSVSLTLLLYLWTSTTSHQIPEGVLHMECRDRYFIIAVNLSFTGGAPQFEAVDETGVYPLTYTYAAQHGYSVGVFPAQGIVELRASYFSCHTYNKKDEVFGFSFNLIVLDRGELKTHHLNETCALALPWVHKEMTCEVNYMEVSVTREVTCSSETQHEDWNAFRLNYPLITEDFHLVLHTRGAQLKHMNLSDASRQGYVFQVTEGRLVFRTAYGQDDSVSTEMSGVPVEVARVTVYSRHSWVMFMIDLVATCSMHNGAYESGYLKWETPEDVDPVFPVDDALIAVGMNGELLTRSLAQQRGYRVKMHNSTFQISIPLQAEGGRRKSLVLDGLYEFYIFNLYVEQVLLEGDQVDARLRISRTLVTPLLPRPFFCENRTLVEERMFSVRLADVPEDVVLVAVALNGQEFQLQASNTSGFAIAEVLHGNNTRGYALKVPFDHPAVRRQFSKQDGAVQYVVMIQFTLHVLPEHKPLHHQTWGAVLMAASPPDIQASCSDSGIRFALEQRPFNQPWQITVGSEPLTSELAERHGYILRSHGQRLQLDVPLFTTGYKYTNLSLNGFTGTFEIQLRDPESAEVHSDVTKTCSFSRSQYISCSRSGTVTVVADLSQLVQSGDHLGRSSLLHRSCGPTEWDSTRALFSFPLNSCGNTAKVGKESVTYENRIIIHSDSPDVKGQRDRSHGSRSLLIQCVYPLEGLNHFFWTYKFESETAGVGRILPAEQPGGVPELQTSTQQPTTARRKWSIFHRPSYHLPYAKIPNYPKGFPRRGASKLKMRGGLMKTQ